MAVEDGVSEGGSEGGFDIDTASNDMANDLFPSSGDDQPDDIPDTPDLEAAPETSASSEEQPTTEVKPPRGAPKSWAKEMHDKYATLDPDIQDYIDKRENEMHTGLSQYKEYNEFGKQMSQAIAPFQQLIQKSGVDAPKAVQALLNAHRLLSESAPDQKKQYFMQLAKDYGIDFGQTSNDQPQIDPTVKALMDKVSGLESTLTQRQQIERDTAYKNVMSEVEAFASDKAHPYFDEVADDIVVLLKTGIDLKDAYEKAVWANPVTRQKEIERLNHDSEAERTRKAQEEAEKAKAATVANIRNRDTRKTPTETNRATMRDLDSVMKESMREIKSRTH